MNRPFLALLATLALLAAFLARPAQAQCVVPLQATSWQETCDMDVFTGPNVPKLRITFSTHIDRTYFAANASSLFPGVVTCSLNRVRYEFVAVQGASEFALETLVASVRATTHVLMPLQTFLIETPQDAADSVETFPPLGLDVRQPWSLRLTAIGGALLQHSGMCLSRIDFRADAIVTVDYTSAAPLPAP